MKQKIALLTIILFTSIVFFSQPNKISGTVKDTIDKVNISNAVSAILRKSDSVLIKFSRTDARGNFTLSNVAAGQYIFMISHPRFGDLLNNNNVIWNVCLSKDILKDMFTIKLSIADIRRENNGFSDITTCSYFSKTFHERLQ